MSLLPYQGDKKIDLTKYLKRNLHKNPRNNVKTQVTVTVQKRSTQFNVKDMTKLEHKHDVISFGKCPKQICINKYFVVNGHRNDSCDNVKTMGNSFRNNAFKRDVAEAVLKKELKPTLNVQEKSVEWKLFN